VIPVGDVPSGTHEPEASHREIIDAIDEAVLIHDAETGRIVEVNRRMLEMYSGSRDQVIGRDMWAFSDGRHPYTSAEALKWITRARGGQTQRFEWLARDLAGREFWVEVHLNRVVIAGRECVLALVRDLAALKRSEQREEDLGSELRHSEHELRVRDQDLEYARRGSETFVLGAAHDLRVPLLNLRGFTEQLRDHIADVLRSLDSFVGGVPECIRVARATLGGGVRHALERITSSTEQCEAILEGLLELARSGRRVLWFSEVDMNALVALIAGQFELTIRRRGASVTVQDLPSCWGDLKAVRCILSNLLSNALRFLHPDRPGEVVIGYAGPAEHAHRYFVRDDGIGIPEHEHEAVFRMFYRTAPSDVPGDGIGLAIVRELVQRQGGEVTVESSPGQGSTFYFTLPSVPSPVLHSS
jgi:PAS domain S-box-containing protein